LDDLTGKQPKISFSDWRAADQKVYITDLTRVSKALKWQPKTDVRTGVARLVEWMTNNKGYFI